MRKCHALCLLLFVPATANANEWRDAQYTADAQEYVAYKLETEKGIKVSPEAVVVDKTKSSFPKLRNRTGRATITWSVKEAGLEVSGRALMKGDMGLLGFGEASGKQVIFGSMNDVAKGQTRTWRTKLEALSKTHDQAETMFKSEVSRALKADGLQLDAKKVQVNRIESTLKVHRFVFKNKVAADGGKRQVGGYGSIAIQWANTTPSLQPKKVEVTKNRRTFGTWLQSRLPGKRRR